MKTLQSGGITASSLIRVEVELSKAEEVAEFGERAPSTKTLNISKTYEMSKEQTLEHVKNLAELEGYDTIVIQKDLYEEEVFYLAEEEGAI